MCLEITYQHLPVGTQLMHQHGRGELCHGRLNWEEELWPAPRLS